MKSGFPPFSCDTLKVPISSLCKLMPTGNSSVWGRDWGSEEGGEMISTSSIARDVISSSRDLREPGCQSRVTLRLTETESSAARRTTRALRGPTSVPSRPSIDTWPLLRWDMTDPAHRRPDVLVVSQAPNPATVTTKTEASNAALRHRGTPDFRGRLSVTRCFMPASLVDAVRTPRQWKSACAVSRHDDLGRDPLRAGLPGCASECRHHSRPQDPSVASCPRHRPHR